MHPLVLVALMAAVVAADASAGCFNTLLYTTPTAIDLGVPLECAGVWRMHTRTVYAAQADDVAATMLVAYADAPGVVRLERYRLDDGALIDSVPLASPPTVGISSACATAYDVWAVAGGQLRHWDAVSGQPRPAGPAVATGGRLACSPTRVWLSAPAARAVLQLSTDDGRIERVVMRVPSPGALAIDADRWLWAIDGQPGITAWVADVANASTGAPAGLYATPLPADTRVVSLATRNAGTAALLLGADGRIQSVVAAGAAQPVGIAQPFTGYARLMASAGLAVRGRGSLVDVHSGAERTRADSALSNNGNLAALAYRPIATAPSLLTLVDATGDIAHLRIGPVNASSTCGAASLVYEERLTPLEASGGNGVRVLHVALDGTIVWADAATGLVRVRLAADGSDDRVLPTLAAPPGAQVRAVGGPDAAVCTLFDTVVECHDLATGLSSPSFTVPADDALVMQWDGASALVLFGVTGGNVLNVWRIEAPLAVGAALEWRCAMQLRHTGLVWAADYWGVAPVGDGGFIVRWSATDALFVDANCSMRAHIDELRPDAQPTLAYVDGTDTPMLCVGTNAPRPVRLAARGIAGWIVVSVLLCLCGVVGAVLGGICMLAPRRMWRSYALRGGSGAAWKRFGGRKQLSWCSLDHDAQASIYAVLSWVCPCVADAVHARMQRWWTPVVFEATVETFSTTSAPISLVDTQSRQAAASLLAEADETRWQEIDDGFREVGTRLSAAAAASVGTEE